MPLRSPKLWGLIGGFAGTVSVVPGGFDVLDSVLLQKCLDSRADPAFFTFYRKRPKAEIGKGVEGIGYTYKNHGLPKTALGGNR